MKSICIKTNNSKLLNYLLRELQCLEIKNVCFNEKKFKHYENIIVHYAGKEQEEFYSSLSTILSFLVIDELEEEFIKRIIIQNYFYFDIKVIFETNNVHKELYVLNKICNIVI